MIYALTAVKWFSTPPFQTLFFLILQMYLNYLGNYVPNTWNYERGCSHCNDDVLDLSQLNVSALNKSFSVYFLLVSSEAVESVNYAASSETLERVKHCRGHSAKHIYQSLLKHC